MAIVMAAILQASEPYLSNFLSAQGISISDNGDYGTLLATIAGIGGVFIGLYYTAISAVGGAIYSRVPNNVRDLLAQDRIGNVYMRFLAVVTYLSVIMLALRTAGLAPVFPAIFLLVLASGVTVFGFVGLGARVFYLFDPTTLSYHLFDQLRHNYRRVIAGHHRWSDPSFQNHAHKMARSAVDTLSTLADLTSREPHLSQRPYATLCKYLLSFLIMYEPQKRKIPTESRWYARRYIHPDWYKSSDAETSIHHQTATPLSPEEVSDDRWLEKEILPMVYNCLALNIKLRRRDIVTELIEYFTYYLKILSSESQVTVALEAVETLMLKCDDLVFSPRTSDSEIESLEEMNLADILTAMPISILLSYVESLSKTNRDAIIDNLKALRWRSESELYMQGLPTHTLPQLEWIYPRLNFEIQIEGHQTTPHWYIGELINKTNAENAEISINALFLKVNTLYSTWLEKANNNKLHWISSSILSREAEYRHKLDHYIHQIKGYWDNLGDSRKIADLNWPTVDFSSLNETQIKRWTDVIRLMSVESNLLALQSRPKDYPDFAGQFLHTVGEAIISAFYSNNRERIDVFFKPFLVGSLLQFNNLRPKEKLSDWRDELDWKISAAPLLDLMDLSGYAFLYSEYYGEPELSRPVTSAWDGYLESQETERPGAIVEFLAGAVALTESGFEMPHRSILRTQWEQTAFTRLQNLPTRDDSRRELSWAADAIVLHESALVRLFARGSYGSLYDGIDIFLAKYLAQRAASLDVDFGSRRYDLRSELEREEQRYKEARKHWDNEVPGKSPN